MIELVATCLFGLEKQLGEEIDALGCQRVDTMDGRVTFRGEVRDIARANVRLRCADRGNNQASNPGRYHWPKNRLELSGKKQY